MNAYYHRHRMYTLIGCIFAFNSWFIGESLLTTLKPLTDEVKDTDHVYRAMEYVTLKYMFCFLALWKN